MADRSQSVLIRSITASADGIENTCEAANELPNDLDVVASMQPLVKDIFKRWTTHSRAASTSRSVGGHGLAALERCEENMRSLYLVVCEALPQGTAANQRAARNMVLPTRLVAERRIVTQLYEDLTSLHQQHLIQAPEKLRLLFYEMQKLESMSQADQTKYTSGGGGSQFNNVNENHGTMNVTNNSNSDNKGQMYFGQHQIFNRE